MRSVPCCLSKMSPSSSTYTGSQIATWMNTSRVQLRSSITVDGKVRKDVVTSSDYRRFLLNPAQRDILPHRQSQLSDLTIRLHITTSLKSMSQIRRLYHHSPQCSKWCFHQFNFLNVSHVTSHSSSSLVNILQLIYAVVINHKYVNVHRHQLLILSNCDCHSTHS